LFLLFTVCSCKDKIHESQESTIGVSVDTLSTPSNAGAQPHLLSVGQDMLLSWVEYIDDSTDALMCSKYQGDQWTDPVTVASGTDWFVNWADYPRISAFGDDQFLAAHWLAKSDTGVYDYDIQISISPDRGSSWTKPFVLHDDSIKAEHGFVSMAAIASDRMLAVWLDGRHTKTLEDGNPGAMTLRSAQFDKNGLISDRVELDQKVCDCCQTSLAISSEGPVVVYRDRSDAEVRDISYVKRTANSWSSPQTVHQDQWKIAGCPVNGPKVISQGARTIVTWFTHAADIPKVYVSFSDVQNLSYNEPIQIDDGTPLGRVDLISMDEQAKEVLVVWLEQREERASFRARIIRENGEKMPSLHLVEVSASRSSGFASIRQWHDDYLLAWTHVDEVNLETQVMTALVGLPEKNTRL